MTLSGFPATGLAHAHWWRENSRPLVWSDSDEFVAVFDPASGETHLLSELPALLLQHVDHQPRTAAELFAVIAGDDVGEIPPQQVDQFIATLKFLAEAELVEIDLAKIF